MESTNTVAYEYYLKGRHKWKSRNSTEEGLVATGLLEKAIDLDNNLMDAKNVLAAAIYHQGDVEKSLKMFEENIKQARKLNDEFSTAKGYLMQGLALWEESKYEQALESYSNALPIFKKLDKKGDILKTLNNMGFVYTCLGVSQKAIEIYTQTKIEAEEIQDEAEIDHAMQLLGVEYTFAKKYDKALSIHLNQLSSINTSNITHYRAWVNCCCGLVYYLKNDYKQAHEYLRIAYDIYHKIEIKSETVWVLSWLILSEIKMGKLDQQENLNTIHEKINQNWLKDIDYPEVHYILFKIYNELQDADKSKEHLDIAYKKLIEIADTIKKKEYRRSFLQARFHNEIVEAWEPNN